MGPKSTLLTAILMTMASLTWLASAILVPSPGQDLMRWGVVVIFGILAAIYWRLYFTRKSAENSEAK